MVKKTVVIYFLSIFLLIGCTNNSHSESSNNIEPLDDNKTPVKNSEQYDSLSGDKKVKLDVFNRLQYIPLEYSDNGKYKLPDLEIENAEVIIFGPIDLKKSKKVTIEFQLQSNDSFNHMTIGIIKNYSPESNSKYEIEKIYSESIDNKLTVTYTSQADSNYSICILGTMANSVGVKNGKIIKSNS